MPEGLEQLRVACAGKTAHAEETAVFLARRTADPLVLAAVEMYLSGYLLNTSGVPHSLVSLTRARELVRAAQDPELEIQLRCLEASLLAYAGDIHQALDIVLSLPDPPTMERSLQAAADGTRSLLDRCSGNSRAALGRLQKARDEAMCQPQLWRHLTAEAASLLIATGDRAGALRLLPTVALVDPTDAAFVAAACGEIDHAKHLLASSVSSSALGTARQLAVNGFVALHEGRMRSAAQHLARAERVFRAFGVRFHAIGCTVAASFALEAARRGTGRSPALRALKEMSSLGLRSCAWLEPQTAEWLIQVGGRDECPRALSELLRGAPPCASVNDIGAHAGWALAIGLTEREAQIVRTLLDALAHGEQQRREQQADDLGITPDTLRVHLWRIRQKLGVTHRGDLALARALDAWYQGDPASVAATPTVGPVV
ncbi:MAG: hypothetical protein E6J20_18475 [Chloroflexi bacterium]|nr:MAG: hypothetical protein E6J20_18475 [Chloroflexota bacterium]